MGIFNTRPRFQDRDMRQLSGDTITLSGDTNIDGVFRYKPGAITGYVLTSADGDGTVMWSPSTGGTGVSIYEVGNGTDSTQRVGVDNFANAEYSAVLGGTGNTSNGVFGFIGGGGFNQVSNFYPTICGGINNTINGTGSFIGGGSNNTITNTESVICGGGNNEINSGSSFIGGGSFNVNNGINCFIGVGNSNTVGFNSQYSGILGGRNNKTEDNLFDTFIIGSFITGDTNNTTYVNNLNIYDNPSNGDTVNSILVRDTDGIVKVRDVSTISGGTGNNIYNSDGVLTSNRILELDGKQLVFSGLNSRFGLFEVETEWGGEFNRVIVNPDLGVNLEWESVGTGNENLLNVRPNGILLNSIDGITNDNTTLLVERNAITTGSQFTGFTGIEYNDDYSTNFVDRSLVDKEYVDNQKPQFINYFEFTGNPITIVDGVNTWYKLNTNSTTSLFSRGDLVHTNNRVTYTGDTSRVFQIEGIININGGNNQEIGASFFRNGSLYPCSQQTTVLSSGGKSTSLPFHCLIKLEESDYIEVFVKNITSTTDITLNNVNVIIREM